MTEQNFEAVLNEDQLAALIAARDSGDEVQERALITEYALRYYEAGDYAEALPLLLRCCADDIAPENTPDYARFQYLTGQSYFALRQYYDAWPYFDNALTGWRAMNDRDGELAALIALTDNSLAHGDIEDGLDYGEAALRMASDVQDTDQQMDVLRRLIDLHAVRRTFSPAIRPLREVLKTIEDLRSMSPALQEGVNILRRIAGGETRPVNSRRHAWDGEDVKEQYDVAIALHALGDVLRVCGLHAAALPYYKPAYTTFVQLNDIEWQLFTLEDMTESYQATERHSDLIDTLQRILTLLQADAERSAHVPGVYRRLGQIQALQGQTDDAMQSFELALQHGRQNPSEAAYVYYLVAQVLAEKRNDRPTAIDSVRQAVALATANNDPQLTAYESYLSELQA